MLLSSTLLILTLYIFGRIVILNRRHKNIMIDILIVIIFSILSFFMYKYTSGTIKTILTCILYSALLVSLFDIKLSKSIFTSILYIIILVIPDLLMLIILIYILGVSKEYYYSVIASNLIGNALVIPMMIVITLILRKPLRRLINYKLSENKKIVVISILAVIFTAVFFYKFAAGYKMNQDVLIYLIAMFAFIIILFTLFRQRMDMKMYLKSMMNFLK